MIRGWTLLGVGALCALATSCVTTEEYNRSRAASSVLQKELDDLRGYQKGLSDENRRLKTRVVDLEKTAADADWVEKQRSRLVELTKQFDQGGALAIPGVNVVNTSEGVAFSVQGEVLFQSGKAEITENGKETLKKLVPTLLEQKKRVRVDGHTDADPIKFSVWKTNLRLSAERGLVVAEFLIQNGLPETRVGVAGYGEHRPSTRGDAADAKKQNRRVEILMLNGD